MPTRRNALKTLAGGGLVGSLSGCVQFATQRTVEYHGTPAMVDIAGQSASDGTLATGVGVEARRTIERFGIAKEIVTRNWGMLYRFFKGDLDEYNSVYDMRGDTFFGSALATFTTPSIQIAGQELTPIGNESVGDIGNEFASIVFPFSQDGRVGDTEAGSFTATSVDDATGRKVLRAFRDAVGAGRSELSVDVWSDRKTTIPDWDGDTRSVTVDEGNFRGDYNIAFHKHNGDFVVLFGVAPANDAGNKLLERVQNDFDSFKNIAHPDDDDFTPEMLQRHLIETNLQGMQGLMEQGRKLIDETQELLAKASNETQNEEDETFRVRSNTQDDLKRLDTIMGGLAEDLLSISTKTVTTDENGDWSAFIERAQTATEIATRAHERVSSYNDTRNEEDDQFVQIEDNLGDLKSLLELSVNRIVIRDDLN